MGSIPRRIIDPHPTAGGRRLRKPPVRLFITPTRALGCQRCQRGCGPCGCGDEAESAESLIRCQGHSLTPLQPRQRPGCPYLSLVVQGPSLPLPRHSTRLRHPGSRDRGRERGADCGKRVTQVVIPRRSQSRSVLRSAAPLRAVGHSAPLLPSPLRVRVSALAGASPPILSLWALARLSPCAISGRKTRTAAAGRHSGPRPVEP